MYTKEISQDSLYRLTFTKTVLMILVVLYHAIAFWKGSWFSSVPVAYESVSLS